MSAFEHKTGQKYNHLTAIERGKIEAFLELSLSLAGQSLNKKIVRKLIFEMKQKGNFVLDKQPFRGFPSAFESIVRFTKDQISFKRQPCKMRHNPYAAIEFIPKML